MAKYQIEMKSVSTKTSHYLHEGWADVLDNISSVYNKLVTGLWTGLTTYF